MLVSETYYEVLNVREDASYEEIRANYRSAILHSHPDKLNNSQETSYCNSNDTFLKIQKAWEVLGDANQRAVYDCNLRSSRQDCVTSDEISIEDMTMENAEEGEILELYYQCRCGDYFFVESSELETIGMRLSRDDNGCLRLRRDGDLAASIVLPCGSCSLKLRVWIDSDMIIC